MRERVYNIGHPAPLVGVLTEPDNFSATRPCVLMLNSGVMHHVGSCRMSVKLARALAKQAGIASCRFDFSGIGDSAPRRGAPSFDESAISEVVEVMDYLGGKLGIHRFILYGLCSGAHASFRTALQDRRVVAIAQIDGYSYKTAGWYLRHYVPRLFLPKVLIRFAIRYLQGVFSAGHRSNRADVSGIEAQYFEVPNFQNTPPKEEVKKAYRQLVQNKTAMFSAFTEMEEYNYPRQFRDSFADVDFGDLLTDKYWVGTSHIMSEPDSQVMIIDQLVHWIKKIL